MAIEKLAKSATQAEAIARVAEVKGIVEKYGFGDRYVYPYSAPEIVYKEVARYENWVSDLDECTRDSRYYVLQHINGFIDILNKWIEYADKRKEEPKVEVIIRCNGVESKQVLTREMINIFLNVEGVEVEEV